MKLVDGKKLFIENQCEVCNGSGIVSSGHIPKEAYPCSNCGGSGSEFISLSPAELAEENLKALAVLEELKRFLEGKLDAHLIGVRNILRHLESQAPVSDLVKKAEGGK